MQKIDIAIIICAIILVFTGAFLRYFKYYFTPLVLEKITLILIPEVLILFLLIAYKLWRR